MPLYTITGPDSDPLEVVGENWLVALGQALKTLERVEDLRRLACEILPNGTVFARDIDAGGRYVVQENILDVVEFEELDAGDDEDSAETMHTRLIDIAKASSPVFACQIALEAATQAVPAESGSVILIHEGQLRFMAAVGPFAARLVGVRLPLGVGVVGHSIAKNETVLLGRVSDDPRHYTDMDRMIGHQTRRMACVPVADDTEVFGVIEVINYPEKPAITKHQVRKIQSIAQTLAVRLNR